jgi:hypothetical protein
VLALGGSEPSTASSYVLNADNRASACLDVTRHCVPLTGGYMLVRDRPCELVALLLLTVGGP